MNVLIVDDHPFVHEFVGAVARRVFGEQSVRHASSLAEAIEKAAVKPAVGLVLLDLGLKDSAGLQTLLGFRKGSPAPRVIVFSATEHLDFIFGAMKAGAAGYLPKTSAVPVIESALRIVAAGERYYPSRAIEETYVKLTTHEPELSQRPMEVLRLIVRGHPNKEIAKQLGLSLDTVKHYARAAYSALGVSSRAQAIVACARGGLTLD